MISLEDRVSLLERQVEAMRDLLKTIINSYNIETSASVSDLQQALKKDLPKSVGEV